MSWAYIGTSKEFILTCDASKEAIRFILGQIRKDNKERVIAYGERATRKPEKLYTITQLEVSAILDGIKEYLPYLSCQHFKIVTDHSAVKSLMKMKPNLTPWLARWVVRIQDLDFEIIQNLLLNGQNFTFFLKASHQPHHKKLQSVIS